MGRLFSFVPARKDWRHFSCYRLIQTSYHNVFTIRNGLELQKLELVGAGFQSRFRLGSRRTPGPFQKTRLFFISPLSLVPVSFVRYEVCRRITTPALACEM